MDIIGGIKKNAKTAKRVGILLIIAGILSLVAPLAAGISVAVLIGVLLAVAGVCQLMLAFQAGSFGTGLGLLVLGALSLLAGVYTLIAPGVALATLTLVLAAYFVVTGIAEVFSALGASGVPGRGWLLFSGIVSVLLGVMIWRQFPLSGVWAVGLLVGIRLLMSGMTLTSVAGGIASAADAVGKR